MRISLLLAAIALAGCGPIRSTMGIVDAERALRDALEVGALEAAPHPIVLAEQLLAKAREEQGYAAYDASMALANEAQALAEFAKAQAEQGVVFESALQREDAAAPAPGPSSAADGSQGVGSRGAGAADAQPAAEAGESPGGDAPAEPAGGSDTP